MLGLLAPVTLSAAIPLSGQAAVAAGDTPTGVPSPQPTPQTLKQDGRKTLYKQSPPTPAKPAKPSKRADQTLQSYTRCLVGRLSAEKLRQLMRMPSGDAGFGVGFARIATEECAPTSMSGQMMSFSALVLRAAMFEAMYWRTFRLAQPDVTKARPLDVAAEFSGPITEAEKYLRRVEDCAGRTDPTKVHLLLLTVAGSKNEAASLAGLMPVINGCVDKGLTVRFSRVMLRGMLAEGMYKLAAPTNRRAIDLTLAAQ